MGPKPPEWSWQGATALTLAIGIFLAESILCIGEAAKLIRNLELSQAGINLITATLSTLVGAVATFIGGRVQSAPTGPSVPPPPPPPAPVPVPPPPAVRK